MIQLTKEITKNADSNQWEELRVNLADLNDNTNNLFDMMDKHNEVSDKILDLLEVVMKDLMNLNALSVYRDFVSVFVGEIEDKLGTEVLVKVRNAIHKRKFKKVNFKQDEVGYISQLEKILGDVNMTVEEFELLMGLKAKSNSEFHKGEEQDVEEVKKQLDTSLSDDLQDFKDPLRKLFNVFDIWKLA